MWGLPPAKCTSILLTPASLPWGLDGTVAQVQLSVKATQLRAQEESWPVSSLLPSPICYSYCVSCSLFLLALPPPKFEQQD